MDQQTHREFLEICRKNGWKCTSQRFAVYEFVRENYTHPSVDDVWCHIKKSLPTVTRESVYRILNEFAERGILQRLDHLDSARYDCETCPQGHFICQICGNIVDFAFPNANEISLLVNDMPGEVRSLELRISGICDKCKEKQI